MKENVSKIFDVEADSWISSLPKYQYDSLNELYSEIHDYEDVAKAWLTASISNTAPFGVKENKSIYFERILDEIELFLNGDEKYEKERLNIIRESTVVQHYIIGVVSTAMSPYLGTSSVFLAPVVAIVLFTITKIGFNAWLEKRKMEKN